MAGEAEDVTENEEAGIGDAQKRRICRYCLSFGSELLFKVELFKVS
jgi:hypothetical protein